MNGSTRGRENSMPIYTSSLGTAGPTTVGGRASAFTTISGMAFRICSFTTASTAGTAFTPTSKDVTANETATAVGASGQTVSSTGRQQHVIFGCGAAGPGGYV